MSADGLVCAECQSREDQADAERRILRMVDREIARRQELGIPPDEKEGPLIAYALGLRDAATTKPDDVAPAPQEELAPPVEERPLELAVAVTGAFLTGPPLDVRLDSYDTVQHRLSGPLRPHGWHTNELRARGGTYESGGGFSEDVPLVVARRDGRDLLHLVSAALDESRSGPGSRLAQQYAPLLDARATSLAIDVYDLGVAVMTAWFAVTAEAEADLSPAARAIRRLTMLRPDEHGRSPLAAALQQIAHQAVDEFERAVDARPDVARQRAWLSRQSAEHGRLLWLHPINVVHSSGRSRSTAKQLAPATCDLIQLDGSMFVPGVGWSAVALSETATAEHPVRITELHWAYYALYMIIDRSLLEILNLSTWTEAHPLKRHEQDANAVFEDYVRIVHARARLDSYLNSLGGDMLAIWETIARVQRFDAVLDGVDRKLGALERLSQRRVAVAAAERARRTEQILGCLTVLTVLTVTGALIGVLAGARTPSGLPLWLRALLVGAALLTAVLIYFLAYVRSHRMRTSSWVAVTPPRSSRSSTR
jgi:hypothetical protein